MASKCECLSLLELLGGGVAFATVAMIAVSSVHIARPKAPVPAAPLHYATTAIEMSEEAARRSLSELGQPSDGAAVTRNAQSSDQSSDVVADGAAALKPAESDRTRTLSPPSLSIDPVPAPPVTTWWPAEGAIEDAAAARERLNGAKSLKRPSDLARRSPYPDRHPGPQLGSTRRSHMPAPETQNALSFDPVTDDTVASRLAKSDRLKPLWAPSQPPAAAAAPPATARPPAGRGTEEAAWIRQHLVDAESSRARAARSLPPPPDQRSGTRLADAEQRPAPVSAGERAAPTFVGEWAGDTSLCGETPLAISSRAAKTGNGECDFGFVAREAANRWRVAAICTSEGQFWRANIALKLVGPNLTWSSERGTETYVRCGR